MPREDAHDVPNPALARVMDMCVGLQGGAGFGLAQAQLTAATCKRPRGRIVTTLWRHLSPRALRLAGETESTLHCLPFHSFSVCSPRAGCNQDQ